MGLSRGHTMKILSSSIMISNRIRDYIKTNGETLAELSRITGIDRACLSRFLKGERGLHSDAIDKLAEYYRLVLVDSTEVERTIQTLKGLIS